MVQSVTFYGAKCYLLFSLKSYPLRNMASTNEMKPHPYQVRLHFIYSVTIANYFTFKLYLY